MEKDVIRCAWSQGDPLMSAYHDEEWGVPVRDDRKIFEFMVLDAAQAGLSWRTVLYKRENYRAAMDNFEPEKIARYTEEDLARLMENAGIIRNKAKLNACITNAQAFLKIQAEFGSFSDYIWQFTGGKTVHNAFLPGDKIPATSPESDAMSADLKKRGFKFVGSTICYAFMQAAGMINDHAVDCFRYETICNWTEHSA